MSRVNPYMIVSMNTATYTKTIHRNSLDDAVALYQSIREDENTLTVMIMEYCPIRNRYSPMKGYR